MAEISEQRVTTDGYESNVLRAGADNDHAIVLLHGGGPGADARANWTGTLEALGAQLDVIAPDVLGFGATDLPDPLVHGPAAWMELRVRQLVAVLDHFGHERADLVGNSLGGALTLNFVMAHPERVGRIVLMGSAGPPFEPGPELGRLLSFGSDPTRENLRALLEAFVYDLEAFGDVEALVEARLAAATDPDALRAHAAMFQDSDGQPIRGLALPEERVRAIEHEALMVHGLQDRIIPLSASKWLVERLPNADLHVLGRCGHWAMLERPGTFHRLVGGFLRQPSVAAAA